MFRRKLGVILAGLMICTSIWGAEESKGRPSSYAGPISALISGLREFGVRFSVNGQEIVMTRGVMEKFSFFQNLTNFTRAANRQACQLTAVEEAALVKLVPDKNLHLLQLLSCVLAASTSLGVDVPTCIQLILLAQRLGLSDWTDLHRLLEHIKTSRAVVMKDLPAGLLTELAEVLLSTESNQVLAERFWLNLPVMQDAMKIIWQPQGDGFFAIYQNFTEQHFTAQRYDATGAAVGTELSYVDNIFWQPQGNGFFVTYYGYTAQRYDATGAAVGTVLNDVDNIFWQPQGNGFFAVHWNGTAQRYDATGAAVGTSLDDVREIIWQPQGDGFFALHRNGTAQRHDVTGAVAVAALDLTDVNRIIWHPRGDGYFVIHYNHTAQRYDVTGAAVGAELFSVKNIFWQPQGQGFFVGYWDDGKVVRYNGAGAPVGMPLANVKEIVWHPEKLEYLVHYRNGKMVHYDLNGSVAYLSTEVADVQWLPNGQGYVLIYRSGEVLLKCRSDYFADLRWVELKTRTHSYKVFINQLGPWLLVQAIANQFAQTGSPVSLSATVQTTLPAKVRKVLNDLGIVPPAAASKNYLLIAARAASAAAIGAAAMVMNYYFSR